jgi:hypothetical protein
MRDGGAGVPRPRAGFNQVSESGGPARAGGPERRAGRTSAREERERCR